VLLLKVALVGVALGFGAFHHFVVRPRLERRAPGDESIRRSLAGDGAVGIAVLLLAAVLVNAKPPVARTDNSPGAAAPATLQR
jgi:putative copper export protein